MLTDSGIFTGSVPLWEQGGVGRIACDGGVSRDRRLSALQLGWWWVSQNGSLGAGKEIFVPDCRDSEPSRNMLDTLVSFNKYLSFLNLPDILYCFQLTLPISLARLQFHSAELLCSHCCQKIQRNRCIPPLPHAWIHQMTSLHFLIPISISQHRPGGDGWLQLCLYTLISEHGMLLLCLHLKSCWWKKHNKIFC